ncbi:uridine kinase [Clostridium butyricum]|uniref:uridine kinase n=1 Tax=Clostridium butyricum TaxID=1492 RepID=UPI00374FCEDC
MTIKIKKINLEIHKFHLFIIAITILKIILMGLFSSDYQNKMFMPFTESFIDSVFNNQYINPYEYYYVHNLIPSFPYPTLMLLIECVGNIGIYMISNVPLFFENLMFKLPSLIFDFLGLYYLIKLFPQRRKYVGVLYFASPIVIYSTYMHGQLDIIPTIFLLGALYYLIENKIDYNKFKSIIMLSAALLCKLHILAVVPVIFLYILKRDNLFEAIKYIMLVLLITIIGMLPFMSQGFINSVIFNNEQGALTQVYFSFHDIKIYLPILAVLYVYLKEFNFSNINKDLLISFCGVLFAVFLVLTPAMPGWYVWVVPFVTTFFININENKYKSLTIYVMLNGLYLIYFIFFHSTENVDLYFLNSTLENIKIKSELLRNITFTLLTGLLGYTTYLMYQLGLKSNSLYKRRNLPFTIGIAGDSGSGKSTFLTLIENILGINNLLFIEGDGDHKWERGEDMWNKFTHLNPKANYLYRQAMDIETLRTGTYVKRVEYDHDTGKFSHQHKIKPKKFIILCGLHSLYLPQMRKNLDLKVYMDSDENLRRYWKIQRDTKYRGYTKEKIIEQIEKRMSDAEKYIIPQKDYADLIIHYFDKKLLNCYEDNHIVNISLKLTLSSAINLELIIQSLKEYDVFIKYDYSEDLKKQTIIFDGENLDNKNIDFNRIANDIIPQLDEITRETLKYENNITGIIELMVLVLISNKMQGDI